MNILFASSEAVPFAKTGGLADVSGALPRHLSRLGHRVDLFLPNYRCCRESGQPIEETGIHLKIPVGQTIIEGQLLRSRLPDSDVTVWLVDQPGLFDRAGIYGENGQDYGDNCARFVFFSRAVLEAIRLADLKVDVIHCNDWQTGLIPAYLKTEYAGSSHHESVSSLLTIHNLGYQGLFLHWDMQLTGMDWSHFNWEEMEFFGQLNLLKTGIVFADALSTVSPTYAREIQTEQQGYGLDGVLRSRASVLHGILNGIDTDVWNPASDQQLTEQYSVKNWKDGKLANKLALQKELGLKPDPDVPLIGSVGRIATQKGFALIMPVLHHWLEHTDSQWVFLGKGDQGIEQSLLHIEKSRPGRVAVQIGFSDRMAHRIEAAADIFLMPSQYEPCGLNQMYSMAYGTIPVVRHTGGLADTVVDDSHNGGSQGPPTGFSFVPMRSEHLEQALARAVTCRAKQPDEWARRVETGMHIDWSWSSSAKKYCDLYQSLIKAKQH